MAKSQVIGSHWPGCAVALSLQVMQRAYGAPANLLPLTLRACSVAAGENPGCAQVCCAGEVVQDVQERRDSCSAELELVRCEVAVKQIVRPDDFWATTGKLVPRAAGSELTSIQSELIPDAQRCELAAIAPELIADGLKMERIASQAADVEVMVGTAKEIQRD